jgi:hypothetical protein
MTSNPPASRGGPTNGTPQTRKPRARSTIGVNPLDASPTPARAAPPQTEKLEGAAAGQRVFAAWAAGTEGVLKALFEAQNSALRANLSVLEASATAQRNVTRELTEAAREAQAAALEAFRTRLEEMHR